MSATILVFVNLSRSDAYVSVDDANGQEQFVAQVKTGAAERQAAAAGQKWSVVANDTYKFTAGDKNRVYLIGASGVYEVDAPRPLAADSGAKPGDFDFPASGGGGWP